MTPDELPRTCIIGAGISGLTAGKRLGDYGIPYDCYESSDRIGGNWAFGNPNGHSSAYWSLHIDTSKWQLSFADFPIPDEYPDFPHHTQIKDYLELYAEAFDLKSNIRFRIGVEHCERRPQGGWEIRTSDGAVHNYDALVVANGHHWDPRVPDFPGSFDGVELHSHAYIGPSDPVDLHDKRVLVVGLGNSGADIAAELSRKGVASKVVISTRSGAWVMPKYVLGRPVGRWYRTLTWVPLSWQRRAFRGVPRLVTGDQVALGLPKPNHHFMESHPTGSDELLLRLASGDVSVKSDIRELRSDGVQFDDGTTDTFDVIIYATGYNITFPFFDPEFISAPDNKIGLYKRMLYPGIDDLLFIGFAQATPTLFPFVECQAGLAARYLAGTWRPPDEAEMRRVIAADEHRFTAHLVDRPRHTQQLDYYIYDHELRTTLIPEGRARVEALGSVPLSRSTAAAHGIAR